MACPAKLLCTGLRRRTECGLLPSVRIVSPGSNGWRGLNASSSVGSRKVGICSYLCVPSVMRTCFANNAISNAQPMSSTGLQEETKSSSRSLVVVSFYKFADVPDYESLREPLRDLCNRNLVSGHIILASEGINGSICGTPEAVNRVLATVQEDTRFADLRRVEAPAGPEDEFLHHGQCSASPLGVGDDDAPFRWDHVRVKLKKEVVPLGVPGVNPAVKVGKYVKPTDWNRLINNPNTVVIDVRNDYEVRVGRFKGAIDPRTTAFREFPAWVTQNLPSHRDVEEDEQATPEQLQEQKQPNRVAMYCTGGIRCEKASSYLLSQGFTEVYHLEGGILRYLDEVPAEDSLWEGECFVFDKRVTVEHGQKQGSYKLCYACKKPVDDEDVKSSLWEEGVSCPHCFHLKTPVEKERARARQKQYERWGKVGGPERGRRRALPKEKNSDDHEPTSFFSRRA